MKKFIAVVCICLLSTNCFAISKKRCFQYALFAVGAYCAYEGLAVKERTETVDYEVITTKDIFQRTNVTLIPITKTTRYYNNAAEGLIGAGLAILSSYLIIRF